MKIAFVVPYVPNLIRIRSYQLITHLLALGIEVYVFTVGSSSEDQRDADSLRTKCTELHYYDQPVWRSLLNCAAALPTNQPLQSVYSWQPDLARDLAEFLRGKQGSSHFDLVHVEHLRGSRFGIFIKSKFPTVPIVWDSVDSISYLFRQASDRSRSVFGKLIPRLELRRTQKAEGRLVCLFDHVLVTSAVDKRALLELVPAGYKPAPISVLSNGVDVDYYRPDPDVQRDSETIVFSGKMSYHANISMVNYFAKEILPRIWQSRPTVRFMIVGKDPPVEVQRMASNPLITVTGMVEDIRPYLWKAAIAVVPLLYGAGIQNKILEAMASGTPVVSTPAVLASVTAVHGRELLIAENPEDFSREALRLLNSASLRQEISEAGLNYVKRNHNWREVAFQLAEIYNQAVLAKKRIE